MKKTVQYFSDEYLEECRKFTPEQIIEFLENFRELQAGIEGAKNSKSKLISIKIPANLLNAFRVLAQANGIPYQTQIKKLMKDWVNSANPVT